MATDPVPSPSGANYRMSVREPTVLMRANLDMSKEFQVHVGRELTVNATDLSALEIIIMNGAMGPTAIEGTLDEFDDTEQTVIALPLPRRVRLPAGTPRKRLT